MEESQSSTRCNHSEGIERITSLPEDLHSRILSLLPTKNAVATSLLSKRWKFVWTCITNLSFDDGYFNTNENFNTKYSVESLVIKSQKFTQFANSVLVQLNPSCIQNFTLSSFLPDISDSFNIQLLVRAAIQLTIQKFELRLSLFKPMELSLSHFNCKTLTFLKLTIRACNGPFNVVASVSVCFPNLLTLYLSRVRFEIANNCSVSFPSLKDLHLDGVEYANKESVHKLFASCPVLDSLCLHRWCFSSNNVQVVIISIPSLRSLVISHERHNSTWSPSKAYKIQIDTPALEYLYLDYEFFCQHFTLENLSCLLNAKVKLCFHQSPDVHVHLARIQKIEDRVSKIIRCFVDARFLSISGWPILEAIGSIPENIAPVFRNLTRLELGIYTCGDSIIVIKKLLERSDNLEHLRMKGYNSCVSHESRWIEPSSVPMCLLRRVTTISLTDIGDCSTEVELIRYFLKNGEVLKLFTIGFSGSSEEKFQLIKQKISMIPRGSRACQVEFR